MQLVLFLSHLVYQLVLRYYHLLLLSIERVIDVHLVARRSQIHQFCMQILFCRR